MYRWTGSELALVESCDTALTTVEVADSWLVTEGRALALGLHRRRFLEGIGGRADAAPFWDAALDLVPEAGDWFPRVELQSRREAPSLLFRLRDAPERQRSVVLATHRGADPRLQPTVKGPDLERLSRARTAVQPLGANETVILSPEGYVVEGAYSALVWWRGGFLCAPSPELARIDSVTARSVLTIAAATGVDVHYESVTPAELEGLEVWALSALHGIRIVTRWIDGPSLAQEPGRLDAWRARLDALRRPIRSSA